MNLWEGKNWLDKKSEGALDGKKRKEKKNKKKL
jgi:hypothetical protein